MTATTAEQTRTVDTDFVDIPGTQLRVSHRYVGLDEAHVPTAHRALRSWLYW